MINYIKDFFQCVKVTWMCRLILAILTVIVLSTYVGAVQDGPLESAWYSIAIIYANGALTIGICAFIVYFVLRAFYNWIRTW